MRKLSAIILICFAVLGHAQESGIKPGISIYGMPCLIQNLVYSCVPRTCDSVVIMQGDSVEFCTYQQISLNTDTAYWLRWHFTGAANLPDTIANEYPSQVPLCYWPRWDSAGTFTVEVFYNGVLTAYPTADCYQQGPSHWYVKIVVLPATGISEHNNSVSKVSPNPSDGLFTMELTPEQILKTVTITDVSGKQVSVSTDREIDLRNVEPGIYFATVVTDQSVSVVRLVKQSQANSR